MMSGPIGCYRSFSFYSEPDGVRLNTVLSSWVIEEYWSSGILDGGQTLGEQGSRLRELLWGHRSHSEATQGRSRHQRVGSGESAKWADFRVSFGKRTNRWVKVSQVSPRFSGRATEPMGLPSADMGTIQEKQMWGWGKEEISEWGMEWAIDCNTEFSVTKDLDYFIPKDGDSRDTKAERQRGR